MTSLKLGAPSLIGACAYMRGNTVTVSGHLALLQLRIMVILSLSLDVSHHSYFTVIISHYHGIYFLPPPPVIERLHHSLFAVVILLMH